MTDPSTSLAEFHSQLAVAFLFVWVFNKIKSSNWSIFKYVNDYSWMFNRGVAVAFAFFASIGIHWTVTGGGSPWVNATMISIPPLRDVVHLLISFILQLGFQEGAHTISRIPDLVSEGVASVLGNMESGFRAAGVPTKGLVAEVVEEATKTRVKDALEKP